MTTQQLIEEGLEEYRELMKVDQSNIQVVELLDKPQVEIRIPFLEDWLTTYSAKLVKEVEAGERQRVLNLCKGTQKKLTYGRAVWISFDFLLDKLTPPTSDVIEK